jgi:hypothetical protein
VSKRDLLTATERWLAGVIGSLLAGTAIYLMLDPPSRQVALSGCSVGNAVGCVVSVDGDFSVFAGVLAALGGAGLVVGLLGVRFTSFKAGGFELSQERRELATRGLTEADQADRDQASGQTASSSPVEHVSEVAPLALTAAMPETDPVTLDQYRDGIYARQHGIFLAHLLSPATRPNQRYRAAIFVVGHKTPIKRDMVRSATMYFGPAWGSKVFQASWSDDGRLGVVTEAHGPFLVLCEVTLTDGARVLLHHYVDFSLGPLLT